MYETFYGLTGKPFQLNPDPAFYFGSRGHKRAFAYLQYGVHQSEGFIVITGEVGAGKTTIVRSLLGQLDRTRLVGAQLVSTQLDADDMLRAVAVSFGLPVKALDKASLLASLEAFLCQLAVEQKRALLVVDEAQNLSPRAVEELRMLSNFQFGNEALMQSFLIGQPELRVMMQGPQMQQLRQRVIASYHLGPLDRSETQAYIEHRLIHVGWKGDPHFEPEAFSVIHSASGGIPRRINTLCNRLMLAGFLAAKHTLNAADVQAIVREIREELGPEAAALASIRATVRDSTAVEPQSMSAIPQLAPVPVVPVADAENWLARVHGMEARMERLEKTLDAAVELLHKALRSERGAKPVKPVSR
jgi:putative secretion ATPase (PEP-CTERM system associated)